MRLQETHRTNATAAARGRAPDPSLLESWVVATSAQWLAGARPRTLPAAVAPVLAGTGVAAHADAVVAWKALLALTVSLALLAGALIWGLWHGSPEAALVTTDEPFRIQPFSVAFLNEYWLYFELTSVLLLAAVVAAVAILNAGGRRHG